MDGAGAAPESDGHFTPSQRDARRRPGTPASKSGRASGAPTVVVAGFARGGARLVARPELTIKSVKELKGKKVGVTRGGIHEVRLMAELQKAGLSAESAPGKDVQMIYLSYPDWNAALLGESIDAMMQSEPQSSQAINRNFGVEVIKPYDTPIGEPVRTTQFTCLLGPSGCGKSTPLNAVAGFSAPTAGTIHVDGKLVTAPGSERGMVF